VIGTLKASVQGTLRKCGYELVKLPTRGKRITLPYEEIHPLATYAPWNADQAFVSTWETIRDYTLVDEYRCWELWMLAEQSAKLQGSIIEVGVWRGGTGALLAKKAELSGIKDPVYLCDTFTGVVKASVNDSSYTGGEHADTSRGLVEHLVRDLLHLSNVTLLQGIFPEETGDVIEDERTFRLCHVDVDVYQSARDIVAWIWKRMVVGGIMVYDDYGNKSCPGITKCVNEQLKEKDRTVIYNLNGHAIVIKTA
jgi:O-methyltransferase